MDEYTEESVQKLPPDQLMNALCNFAMMAGEDRVPGITPVFFRGPSKIAKDFFICRKEVERRLALLPAAS